jgi:hypothetical protein
MSVLVRPKKPGFFQQLLGIAAPVAGLIPGMQGIAPFLGAASALANGDAAGAAGSMGQVFGGDQPPVNQGSTETWQDQWNKQQQMNYEPEYNDGGPSLLMRQLMMRR